MSLPYFPMFPTDFEAKTSHLTLEEDGAYNRLLRLMWMTPGCTLPDDDAWIMRRMRVDQDTFSRVVLGVILEFCERSEGRVSNAKLVRVFRESSAAHEKRVTAGSLGGKTKALKYNKTKPSNAKAMLYQPEPEPEPDKKKEIGKPISRRPVESLVPCIDHFNAVAETVGWAQVQKLTDARRAALSHRVSDCGGQDAWCEAITRAAASPLLTGQTGRGWRADFDWLCKAANFTKLMEGNYDPRPDDRGNSAHQRGSSGPHDSMVAAFAYVANREPH